MERRSSQRIQIPGTQVRSRRLTGLGVFNMLSKPSDIIDISKSGVSFEVNEVYKKGESVLIRLTFPDGKSFSLKGTIRWQNVLDLQGNYRVGIQFIPFGSSRKYNSIKALEYFRNKEGLKTEQIIKSTEDEET